MIIFRFLEYLSRSDVILDKCPHCANSGTVSSRPAIAYFFTLSYSFSDVRNTVNGRNPIIETIETYTILERKCIFACTMFEFLMKLYK